MRRVESYAALTPLLSAQLRRGVVTNCFLSPADYQREIDAGLFYEEGDGFLLLLRQRAGYRLLNFYLHPGAKLCLPEQPSPLITELACREKDQDAMRRAQDALCALGFAECFHRLRRTRAAIPVQNTAETPAEASFEAVRAFLLEQFDPLTGCIPPDEKLRQAVGAGQVLCLMDADGISGLLHYAPGGRSARSAIWPSVRTAGGMDTPGGCWLCWKRRPAGRNAPSGRGWGTLLPSISMKKISFSRTDGSPLC